MNGRTNSTKEGDTIINGALIPLEPPTNLEFVPRNQAVRITWEDPLDKYTTPGDDLVTAWDHTLLIRKEGSAPSSPTDGIEVLKETTRNQYIENYYTDENLTNGITYHYALYAYGTNNTISDPTISSVEARTGVPVYHQKISGLSQNISETAGGTCGDKYFFVGGYGSVASRPNPFGNMYNADLTRSVLSIPEGAADMASADLNNYAIFGGGYYETFYNNTGYKWGLDSNGTIYDISGTWQGAYRYSTGVSIGTYGFFEGTNDNFGTAVSDDLTISTIDGIYAIHDEIQNPGGASIGGYGIFAGGYNREFGSELAWPKTAIAYDESLTRRSVTSLTYNIVNPVGTQNSNYAFISGTRYGASARHTDAYDTNLTKVTATAPPAQTSSFYNELTGTHLGTFALFLISHSTTDAIVTDGYMYDEDLTYTLKELLIPATQNPIKYGAAKDPYGLYLASDYTITELHVLTT